MSKEYIGKLDAAEQLLDKLFELFPTLVFAGQDDSGLQCMRANGRQIETCGLSSFLNYRLSKAGIDYTSLIHEQTSLNHPTSVDSQEP